MKKIRPPKRFMVWAKAEVAAGRAESVEALIQAAVAKYQRELAAFRATLDAASAEVAAGLAFPADAVFRELEALYPDEPRHRRRRKAPARTHRRDLP
jgi:hypothetical protein